VTKRRWIEYAVAVLVGNGIYFWVLHPGLPPALQNQPYRFDAGLAIDFLCCVLVYVAIRLGSRHAARERRDPRLALTTFEGRTGSARDRRGSSKSQTDEPSGSKPAG